jgi:hypothetical protein
MTMKKKSLFVFSILKWLISWLTITLNNKHIDKIDTLYIYKQVIDLAEVSFEGGRWMVCKSWVF